MSPWERPDMKRLSSLYLHLIYFRWAAGQKNEIARRHLLKNYVFFASINFGDMGHQQ